MLVAYFYDFYIFISFARARICLDVVFRVVYVYLGIAANLGKIRVFYRVGGFLLLGIRDFGSDVWCGGE